MKRLITKRQEQIFRLCHHDFAGLSDKAAAVILDTTASNVRNILATIRRVAPQLFPILTQKQQEVWWLWIDFGLTFREIADYLNISFDAVKNRIKRIQTKLEIRVYGHRQQPDVYYTPEIHDHQIKQKF